MQTPQSLASIATTLSDMRDELIAQAANLPDRLVHLRVNLDDLIAHVERDIPIFHDAETANEFDTLRD